MRALPLAALVLSLCAPAATAHPVPGEVLSSAFPCNVPTSTLGQTLDWVGGHAGWMVLAIARHDCEHLFGSC